MAIPVDPVAATQFALDITKHVIVFVKGFIDNANYHYAQQMRDLCAQLASLQSIIKNVQVCLCTPMLLDSLRNTPDDFLDQMLAGLAKTLTDCADAVKDFGEVFSGFPSGDKIGWWERGYRGQRLEWREGQFEEIRRKLQTHQVAIQVSLSAMQLRSQMQNQVLDALQFQKLHTDLDELKDLLTAYATKRTMWEATETQNQTLDSKTISVFHNLDDIERLSGTTMQHVAQKLRQWEIQYGHGRHTPSKPFAHARPSAQSLLSSDREVDRPKVQKKIHSSGDIPMASSLSAISMREDRVNSLRSTPSLIAPSSSDSFEVVLISLLARCQVEEGRSIKPLGNTDFDHIADYLRHLGAPEWAERPRTYFVLRLIDSVSLLDDFIRHGLKDMNFPYTSELLPGFIRSYSVRQGFLDKQAFVLSPKSADLVKGGRHRYIGGSHGADSSFVVIRSLGKGGQGIVDVVRRKTAWQEYARKRVPRSINVNENQKGLESFENEINNLKRLKHMHLVQFVGSYTDIKYFGFIMDPVADTDLGRYLLATIQNNFEEHYCMKLRGFMGCLCAAVQYLHYSGCRHKDIKPANILIKNDTVLITDFGIALDTTELGQDTTSGPSKLYTPAYAAPEVFDYQGRRNFSTDMYSLGCLYLDIMTVLKRCTLWEKETFFVQHGNKLKLAWQNPDGLAGWMAHLEDIPYEPSLPIQWIREMTATDSALRPSAASVLSRIQSSSSPSLRYCGVCCNSDEDTSESDADEFWQASDSDEQGNGYTLSSVDATAPSFPGSQLSSAGERQSSETDSTAGSRRIMISTPVEPDSVAVYVESRMLAQKPQLPPFPWQDPTRTFSRHLSNLRLIDSLDLPTKQEDSDVNGPALRDREGKQEVIASIPKADRAMKNHPDRGRDVPDSTPSKSDDRSTDAPLSTGTILIDAENDLPAVDELISNRDGLPDANSQEHMGLKADPVVNGHIPKASQRPLQDHAQSQDRPDAMSCARQLIKLNSSRSTSSENYMLGLQRTRGEHFLEACLSHLDAFATKITGPTIMLFAMSYRDPTLSLRMVRALLKAGVPVNSTDTYGSTACHLAASKPGHSQVLMYLLRHGADPQATDCRLRTPLHMTSMFDDLAGLRMLINSNKVDIDCIDDRGRTPLLHAARCGNTEIVRSLLQAGADASAVDLQSRNCWSLCPASRKGDLEAVLRKLGFSVEELREGNSVDTVSAATLQVQVAGACTCETCRILAVMKVLRSHNSDPAIACSCSFHIKQYATHMATAFDLEADLERCECDGCLTAEATNIRLASPKDFCNCLRCRAIRREKAHQKRLTLTSTCEDTIDQAWASCSMSEDE